MGGAGCDLADGSQRPAADQLILCVGENPVRLGQLLARRLGGGRDRGCPGSTQRVELEPRHRATSRRLALVEQDGAGTPAASQREKADLGQVIGGPEILGEPRQQRHRLHRQLHVVSQTLDGRRAQRGLDHVTTQQAAVDRELEQLPGLTDPRLIEHGEEAAAQDGRRRLHHLAQNGRQRPAWHGGGMKLGDRLQRPGLGFEVGRPSAHRCIETSQNLVGPTYRPQQYAARGLQIHAQADRPGMHFLVQAGNDCVDHGLVQAKVPAHAGEILPARNMPDGGQMLATHEGIGERNEPDHLPVRNLRQRVEGLPVEPEHIRQDVGQMPMLREPLAGGVTVEAEDASTRLINREVMGLRQLADSIKARRHDHMKHKLAEIMEQSAEVCLAPLHPAPQRGGSDDQIAGDGDGQAVLPEREAIEEGALAADLVPGAGHTVKQLNDLNRQDRIPHRVEAQHHHGTIEACDRQRTAPRMAPAQLEHLACQRRIRANELDDVLGLGVLGRRQIQQSDCDGTERGKGVQLLKYQLDSPPLLDLRVRHETCSSRRLWAVAMRKAHTSSRSFMRSMSSPMSKGFFTKSSAPLSMRASISSGFTTPETIMILVPARSGLARIRSHTRLPLMSGSM